MLNISITYCAVWHYLSRAVSVTEQILKEFEPKVERLVLIPSDGGRFEIEVNSELIYSKLATRRHVEPGEIQQLIRQVLAKQ